MNDQVHKSIKSVRGVRCFVEHGQPQLLLDSFYVEIKKTAEFIRKFLLPADSAYFLYLHKLIFTSKKIEFRIIFQIQTRHILAFLGLCRTLLLQFVFVPNWTIL